MNNLILEDYTSCRDCQNRATCHKKRPCDSFHPDDSDEYVNSVLSHLKHKTIPSSLHIPTLFDPNLYMYRNISSTNPFGVIEEEDFEAERHIKIIISAVKSIRHNESVYLDTWEQVRDVICYEPHICANYSDGKFYVYK